MSYAAFKIIPLDSANITFESQGTREFGHGNDFTIEKLDSISNTTTSPSLLIKTLNNNFLISGSNGVNVRGNKFLRYTFPTPVFLSKLIFKYTTDSGSGGPADNVEYYDPNDVSVGTYLNQSSAGATIGELNGDNFNEQTILLPHNHSNPARVKYFEIKMTSAAGSHGIGIDYIQAFSDFNADIRKDYNIEINDSEFEREGWKNARYKGTKLTSAKINEFTEGDVTFGREPVIEQYSKTVYVFNQAENSLNTVAGVFYPEVDEFEQSLPDKTIVGATKFKLDRAVTFNIDDPSDFSQIEPGNKPEDPSFHFFDSLMKHDLKLKDKCSIRFFNNQNNGFVKPQYNVCYNKGEFFPAAAYFLTVNDGSVINSKVNAGYAASNFTYNPQPKTGDVDNKAFTGRLYVNPNVEEWFIDQTGASGSQGNVSEVGIEAITLDHLGTNNTINSVKGYYYGLSSQLSLNTDKYFISFNLGKNGFGILSEKNLIKAYNLLLLDYSGSNFTPTLQTDNMFGLQASHGRFSTSAFPTSGYESTTNEPRKEEYVLFREKERNNVIHLDFNISTEAPAGIGNGGVIIPDNLHPVIKESLNIFLSNAGLGATGGTSANFNLGGVSARKKATGFSQREAQLEARQNAEDIQVSNANRVNDGDGDDDDFRDDIFNLLSDIRLKENIIFLRKSLSGIPIYKFNYKGK